MGRVYSHELAALADTFRWARAVAVYPIEAFVAEALERPLVAVGSGGSATAAHLAALLHRKRSRAFARHATPLDVLLSEPNLDRTAVLLLSASGTNRDMLTVLRACTACDVPDCETPAAEMTDPGANIMGSFQTWEKQTIRSAAELASVHRSSAFGPPQV